jgi:hypothetical protein
MEKLLFFLLFWFGLKQSHSLPKWPHLRVSPLQKDFKLKNCPKSQLPSPIWQYGPMLTELPSFAFGWTIAVEWIVLIRWRLGVIVGCCRIRKRTRDLVVLKTEEIIFWWFLCCRSTVTSRVVPAWNCSSFHVRQTSQSSSVINNQNSCWAKTSLISKHKRKCLSAAELKPEIPQSNNYNVNVDMNGW